MLAADNPLNHVVQHTAVFLSNETEGFWSLPIVSNHIIMQIAAALLVILLIPRLIRRRAGNDAIGRFVPQGPATALETICVVLRDQIFKPNMGPHADRFTPFLWSTFFFILAMNLLGMLPLSDWFWFVPGHLIGGTATANIYVTGALALVTLVMIIYNGLRLQGQHFVSHFFMGPWYISWFIAFLEVLGLGFKAMALCVRLFANMLAGHILLAVLLGFANLSTATGAGISLAVILVSVAFNFLEIFVAFLHAFIFTMLTAIFLGQAVNLHHDDHDDAHADEHGHAPAAAHH